MKEVQAKEVESSKEKKHYFHEEKSHPAPQRQGVSVEQFTGSWMEVGVT